MLPEEGRIRVDPREEVSPEEIARRKRIIRLYFTAIILLICMLSYYIALCTKAVEIKSKIKEHSKTIENLESSNQEQKARQTEVGAIDKISEEAKKLGMVEPGKPYFIKLPSNWKEIYGK